MQNEETKTIPVETADSLNSKGFRLKKLKQPTELTIRGEAGPVERADNMITQALASNRSMDEVEKLIQLRNAEIERVARLEYKAALSRFQELAPPITRNKNVKYKHKDGNGETNYDYSTLGHTRRTIAKPLADCGLSYDWKTRYEGTKIFVKCVVSHIGGHSESDELMGEHDPSGGKNGIQAMKSTISYLRRGALESVLGLVQEEDDNDGRHGAPYQDAQILNALRGQEEQIQIKALRAGKTTLTEIQSRFALTDEQIEVFTNLIPL